ncbi:MAG: hypothetical protein ACE5ER_03440 [Nitrospinaceae bacterium]
MNATLWAAAGIGAGVYFFFRGFRDLKTKRTIENIPTSRIATGAVGSGVEVKGRIVCEPDKLMTGPVSGAPCAFYSLEIQVFRRSKNSGHWVTLDKFFSGEGFYLDDNSGANALVLVDGAKITHKGNPHISLIRSNRFSEMGPSLRTALGLNKKKIKRFKMRRTSWLFAQQYRFLEQRFLAGETVYVLGFAKSGFQAMQKIKVKFKTFLQAKKMIQQDPRLQQQCDLNQDGRLDPDELERGAKKLAGKLQAKYSPGKLQTLMPKTRMIFQKKRPYIYHISNLPEQDLVKKMARFSTLEIWGGPALTLASTLLLLYQFQVLSF